MPPVGGEKRHGYIDSLIYWRDPKTSAGVLAAGLGFFALTIVFRYSYTALACMFFLVHLLVSAIYSFVQHWNGKKVSDWTRPLKIDKDEAAKIALRVALDFNAAVDWYFGLAAARDLGTLVLVLVVLFAMWTVATLFSDSGLCLIVTVISGAHILILPGQGFVLSFIVPVMYDKNKAFCDQKFAMIKDKILAMIPVADGIKKAPAARAPTISGPDQGDKNHL